MREDSTLLTAALRYAARGWPVFPCSPETKRPLVHSDIEGEGGLKLATTDEATIRGWWRRWPNAMIGMPTGRTVGVVVVDLDPRIVRADHMLAGLQRFCGPGPLPPCPLVRTQSGGLHLWFAYPSLPDGETLGNRAGLFRKLPEGIHALEEVIREHVDIRAEGGYVILPPSRMESGNRYEWEQAAFELGEDPFPPLPPRLLDAILKRGEFGAPAPHAPHPGAAAGPALSPARGAEESEDPAEVAVRRYALAALDRQTRLVAQAGKGQRNQQLNDSALGLAHIVAAGALTEPVVRSALESAAVQSGLAADDGIASVRATLDSAFRAGLARPYDFTEIRENARARSARRGPRAAGRLRDGPQNDSVARAGARPPDPSEPIHSASPHPSSGEQGETMNPRGEDEGANGGLEPAEGGAGGERTQRARVMALAQDSDKLWRAIAQPLNDTGNGRRLLIWFGDELMYVRDVGWHRWCGTHWDREGGEEHALRCAQLVSALIEIEADELSANSKEQRVLDEAAPYEENNAEDLDCFEKALVVNAAAIRKRLDEKKKKRRSFGVSSGNASRLNGMMACAAPHCTVSVDRLDADPWAFNVMNGTVHFSRVQDVENANSDEARWMLKVELRPHARGDYITKVAPFAYDSDAQAPLWNAFMDRFQPRPQVRRFVQSYHGYGLTGINAAQQLVYYWGRGANGKSVFIEVVARIMGGYLQMLPVESLSGEERRRGDQATPEFARLPGARIVRVSELEKGMKLKEALIKQLTGGEPILARHLHKGFFEFRPVFKAVLSSNHKPEIYGSDEGIWRRVNIVPWPVTIPVEERRDFDEVVAEYVTEASGIFNWLVEGLRIFVEEGLRPPEEVRAATAEHRADMDPIARFTSHCVTLAEGCDAGAELEANPEWEPPEEWRVTARSMFEAFNRYLAANGLKTWSETAFGRQMGERAEVFGFRRFEKRVRFYGPIKLHDIPQLTDPRDIDPGWRPPDSEG